MASKDRHVIDNGSPTLARIAREWTNHLDDMARKWQDVGDVPWNYTERALLSVWAGAVWTLGGIAFEEYASTKKSKRSKFAGREDIYFALDGREFKAEAKHQRARATRIAAHTVTRLRRRLDLAVDDVRNCPRDGQQRLGMLFATLFISPKKRNQVDELIEEWIREVYPSVPCTVAAAVFPKCVRKQCIYSDGIWPGAAVFIRKVGR